MRQRIPASLFACASSTRLQVSEGIFPETTTPLALAQLTEIDLFSITISDGTLNSLLSQCTALEYLTMHGMSKCRHVHVRSPKLKVLSSCGNFEELLVEDAPNLEYVLGKHMHLRRVHLKIAHAPKLDFLGYLNTSRHLIEIVDTMLKALMPCLKTLAVEVCYTTEGYIDCFMQLLTLCPCLETLYIKSDTWSVVRPAAPGSWEAQRSPVPSCIDNHLEKVVFEVYRGHEWQREMAMFLHRRSKYLKTMEFHCMVVGAKHSEPPSEEWLREQRELLCLDGQASRDARFLFFSRMFVSDHAW